MNISTMMLWLRLKELVERRDEESHEGYKQLQFPEFNLEDNVVPTEESNVRHGSNEKVRKKFRDKRIVNWVVVQGETF